MDAPGDNPIAQFESTAQALNLVVAGAVYAAQNNGAAPEAARLLLRAASLARAGSHIRSLYRSASSLNTVKSARLQLDAWGGACPAAQARRSLDKIYKPIREAGDLYWIERLASAGLSDYRQWGRPQLSCLWSTRTVWSAPWPTSATSCWPPRRKKYLDPPFAAIVDRLAMMVRGGQNDFFDSEVAALAAYYEWRPVR